MEIVSHSSLTPEDIRSEVAHIIGWLRERNLTELEMMYGVGCGSSAAAWLPAKVALENLDELIAQSERDGLFRPGNSDLWIMTQDHDINNKPKVEFRLCHEADIHVVSGDAELLAAVKAHWVENGWRGYQGTGGRGYEWTTFP